MGDTVIITEDEKQPPKPDVVVVVSPAPKPEKVVTEKTTIVETKVE